MGSLCCSRESASDKLHTGPFHHSNFGGRFCCVYFSQENSEGHEDHINNDKTSDTFLHPTTTHGQKLASLNFKY